MWRVRRATKGRSRRAKKRRVRPMSFCMANAVREFSKSGPLRLRLGGFHSVLSSSIWWCLIVLIASTCCTKTYARTPLPQSPDSHFCFMYSRQSATCFVVVWYGILASYVSAWRLEWPASCYTKTQCKCLYMYVLSINLAHQDYNALQPACLSFSSLLPPEPLGVVWPRHAGGRASRGQGEVDIGVSIVGEGGQESFRQVRTFAGDG